MTLRADLGSAYTPALALAAASETVLYAAGTDPSGTLCLGSACLLLKIVLDPGSTTPLSVTAVGPFHAGALPVGEITGMAFRANGSLYAVSQVNSGLYIVDPATGAATLVGTSNADLHGGDITFDAEDRLWAWTNGPGSAPGFYELDPASAWALPVDTSVPDSYGGLASLGHTNRLYGASTGNDALHELTAGVGRTGIIVPLSYQGVPFDHKRGDLDSPACQTGAFCDDANLCTDDSCEPGGCRHAAVAGCCLSAADCDDANPCTDDACTGSHTCAHTNLDGGQTTCGTGACQRTVTACIAGTPQSCQPGLSAAETCNGVDDDCDGATDEGVPAPAGVPAVSVTGGTATILSWTPVAGAFQYEAVQGSLATLASTQGDFTTAFMACIGSHLTVTSAGVPGSAPAGGGYWYLVRPASCSTPGTFAEPGQAAPRDAEIAAAPAGCHPLP